MFPEWMAGYFRNQWPDVSGIGGRMLRNAQPGAAQYLLSLLNKCLLANTHRFTFDVNNRTIPKLCLTGAIAVISALNCCQIFVVAIACIPDKRSLSNEN
ncbi:hypothetical protein J7438_23220 [Thalassotalea sp. G20_0]|uniref:hypothetical protein n=1 Tax=Thalassotalea sp. G20_0 TaxID=2821093 RepID=UPI001ADA259F|nr:hypothetical protein [Thalassotalea sp. G20_0]MBO9496977.1 hypothetical protein [Thalassotalea sp. G20_0]